MEGYAASDPPALRVMKGTKEQNQKRKGSGMKDIEE